MFHQAAPKSDRFVYGACPHDCPDTCALKITVAEVDGVERVIKVQGRAEHPSTHGALCTKVSRYAERTYHPERLLHPLKRVSRKNEPPRFERVTWAEACCRARRWPRGCST
jgi:anaerobic selenocysteine-containing dehydrogenase